MSRFAQEYFEEGKGGKRTLYRLRRENVVLYSLNIRQIVLL